MWNNIDYNIFAYACIVLLIIIERMCTFVVKFYIHSFVVSFVHSFTRPWNMCWVQALCSYKSCKDGWFKDPIGFWVEKVLWSKARVESEGYLELLRRRPRQVSKGFKVPLECKRRRDKPMYNSVIWLIYFQSKMRDIFICCACVRY